MKPLDLNLWVRLAAAVVKVVLGAVWYSPPLFATAWRRLAKVSEEEMKAGLRKGVLVDFVGGFVMAFVLAHAIRYANAQGAGQGMAVGFFNWLGFVATVNLSGIVFERRPFNLFLVNSGFLLVSLLVMGAMLALWV